MTFPFANERAWFPILQEKIQLSSCSQSAMSIQVNSAIQEYIDSWRYGGMDWQQWMVRVHEAKSAFAQLINASVDEIAILASVSDSVSSIATSLSYTTGRNKVIATELDFPCIGHAWLAQKRRGADVHFIPSIDNRIPHDSYENYIDSQTLITSIPHVSYYNGFKQDIKKIAAIAHEKGSYVFVDAYQSAGNVPIDVHEMGIDFLATGTQKYLLGIPGIAFLYVRKELTEQLQPTVTGWFGRVDPFAFDIKNLDFADGARRFDTGTPAMINAYAAHAALNIILEIGVERIEAYTNHLSSIAIDYAQRKGLTVASPLDVETKAATTAIFIDQASLMEQQMKERDFIVSARNDVIRIAPHFYNTEEDVIKALDMLAYLKKNK